jgi:hypothetical protein
LPPNVALIDETLKEVKRVPSGLASKRGIRERAPGPQGVSRPTWKENLMRIGRKRFQTSLALAASLFLSSVTFAAQETKPGPGPTGDWAVLKTVTSGSKLHIKLKNGKTVAGKLSGVSDTGLSLSVSGKPVDLNREDVLSVYQITGKSAKKPTLIGLGAGAAAGAVLGAVGGDSKDGWVFISKKEAAAGLSVLGAGVGALTGFLISRGGHKRVLIYEAKQP